MLRSVAGLSGAEAVKINAGLRMARVDRERPLKMRTTFRKASFLEKSHGQIKFRIGRRWIRGSRGGKMFPRGAAIPQIGEGHPQIKLRDREIWIQSNRFFIFGNRLGIAFRSRVRVRQIIMDEWIIGPYF